jgi:ABC-type dipeptide/oligopeptide/nickel transport system permease subunit
MDYILAARAVGAGHWRIIFHHMVPNVFAVYLVIATFYFAGAIIAEASLSFLGVGSPPNVATWGGMLTGATSFIRVKPEMILFPVLAISIVVFAWNMLGDSLRDVLDPRMRGAN